jgi:hypothetical protein
VIVSTRSSNLSDSSTLNMRVLHALLACLFVILVFACSSVVEAKKSGDIIILGGWGHGWGHNLIKSGKKSEGDIIILGGWGGWGGYGGW